MHDHLQSELALADAADDAFVEMDKDGAVEILSDDEDDEGEYEVDVPPVPAAQAVCDQAQAPQESGDQDSGEQDSGEQDLEELQGMLEQLPLVCKYMLMFLMWGLCL